MNGDVDIRGLRVVVIGAAVAGAAAAEALSLEGADVLVSEARPLDQLDTVPRLHELGIEVAAGGHDPSHLDGATLVVTGPGVPQDAPILTWAIERGIPVWGELELGARLCEIPYLAVTGTNGKTTTTGMIASCVRAGGHDAIACGNIGHPFPLAAREGHDALVVEASSFQLRFVATFHPRVSVLLNLAPDHLDWHGSEDAYVDAKRAVMRAQGEGDVHVGNRDDARSAAVSAGAPCPVVWFTVDEPGDGEVGYVHGRLVSRMAGEEMLGPVGGDRAGYRADAAAAAAASLAFGVSPEAIREGLASFTPAVAPRVWICRRSALVRIGSRASSRSASPPARSSRSSTGCSPFTGPVRSKLPRLRRSRSLLGRERCCSRLRARAGTCSMTTPSAATASRPPPAL
jgi:UDP-N-acetylmuramoylalanine--D-glutamate ligase